MNDDGRAEMRVVSWNVRRPLRFTRPADRWDRRRPRLHALLSRLRPTILGAQEVVPEQADEILRAIGPSARFVGRGRTARGTGEGCPIFWDDGRLELLRADQHALSRRPDSPGSRSWGSVFPRILVTAEFRERTSGIRLLVLNTHLDAFSERARVRSAEMLSGIAGASEVPVVLTGDLNAVPGSATHEVLLAGGVLADAWRRARARDSAEWGTWADYRPPRANGRRLDVVFVSAGVRVDQIAIDHRAVDGGWASDHLAVVADLSVDGRAGR